MKQRLEGPKLVPKAYKVLVDMEKFLNDCNLEILERELIKIRTSQINQCAYCLEMHANDAVKNGESHRRIIALSAWHESPLFSERERALLAITEEVTLISEGGLSEETYQNARVHFSDTEIMEILIQIGQINVWNRLAVSLQQFHPM